jgi:plasmid stability protein
MGGGASVFGSGILPQPSERLCPQKPGWILARNIEKDVKVQLQRRAARHGRSMEEEVRDILRNAVNEQDAAAGGLGTEIASLFAKVGLEEEIPELRGYQAKPARFDR